jgi:hypothetical protein
MGIAASCCNSADPNKKTEMIVSFSLDSELDDKDIKPNIDNNKLQDIISANNIEDAFNFITSENYYKLLFKISYPYIIIGKIIQNLENSDLLSLLQKLLELCLNYHNVSNKYIDYVKINLDYGTKNTFHEINLLNLESINQNNSFKKLFIKILSDLSLIYQYFKYENEKDNNEDYKENYWKDLKIEEELKTYVYKIDYNLIKLKNDFISVLSPLNNEFATSSKTCEETNNKEKIHTRDITIKIYKDVENFVNNISKL